MNADTTMIPARLLCVVPLLSTLLLALSALTVLAQADTTRSDTTDLPADSAFVFDPRLADTTRPDSAAYDSLLVRRPSQLPAEYGAPIGAIVPLLDGTGYDIIDKRLLVWRRYETAWNALLFDVPFQPLSQGTAGLYRAWSYAGADPSSIAILYNGRPMRRADGAAYNIENYPTEFLERVEILRGVRALALGDGESLVAINFVGPRFDVQGSYARVFFVQGTHSTTTGDISFSRNVGDRMNLALGFRRITSDGIFRNNNQNVSSWNGRGSLTWYPDSTITLSLTELFTDVTRGTNGGLQSTSSNNEFNARVMNDSLSERTLRHDITLAVRYDRPLPAGFAHISLYDTTLTDSTLAATNTTETVAGGVRLDGAFYYSMAERELLVGEERAELTAEGFAHQDIFGLRGHGRFPLGSLAIEGMANIELSTQGDLRGEAGGLLEAGIGDRVVLRGGVRLYERFNETSLGLAGEAAITLDSLELRTTLRATTTLNKIQIDANDTLRYLIDERTPLIAEGEAIWRNRGVVVQAGAIWRRAEPIVGTTAYTTITGSLGLRLPLPLALAVETRLLATLLPDGDKRFPLLNGSGDLFGEWKLFQDNLELRVGTTLAWRTSFEGLEYNPVRGALYYPVNPLRNERQLNPLWNAYVQARIGSAYLRVEMYNLIDTEYYTLYRYPVFGRHLIVAVNWAFVD